MEHPLLWVKTHIPQIRTGHSRCSRCSPFVFTSSSQELSVSITSMMKNWWSKDAVPQKIDQRFAALGWPSQPVGRAAWIPLFKACFRRWPSPKSPWKPSPSEIPMVYPVKSPWNSQWNPHILQDAKRWCGWGTSRPKSSLRGYAMPPSFVPWKPWKIWEKLW